LLFGISSTTEPPKFYNNSKQFIMKKILSVLTVLAIVFAVSSCGNKKKKESHSEGTHVHEDGTVHANDAHDHDAKPAQESFEVKEDNHAEHKHEGGDHDHEHEHGEHK